MNFVRLSIVQNQVATFIDAEPGSARAVHRGSIEHAFNGEQGRRSKRMVLAPLRGEQARILERGLAHGDEASPSGHSVAMRFSMAQVGEGWDCVEGLDTNFSNYYEFLQIRQCFLLEYFSKLSLT